MGTAKRLARFLPCILAAIAILLADGPRHMASASADLVTAYDASADERGDRTFFFLDLAESVDVSLFTLTGGYRLVIDLPELNWAVPWGSVFPGEGLVNTIRYARNRPGHARIILDLSGPARVVDEEWGKLGRNQAHRLTIELAPTDHRTFAATAGWPHQRSVAQNNSNKGNVGPVQKRRVVVIDPGHGGHDPGAIGAKGLYEKSIVLKMALQLKMELEARKRYDVHLTRVDDTFVAHKERVAYARGRNAELFVSLHADANEVKTVRGTSVYTLDQRATDGAAARLVEKENAVHGIGNAQITSDVLKILIDLAQRDTMQNSVRFAQFILPKLRGREIALAPKPHRGGPFYVLTAADVPSVLIEMGFLSNQTDSRLLSSVEWRGRMAKGLADAMDVYFMGHAAMAHGG